MKFKELQRRFWWRDEGWMHAVSVYSLTPLKYQSSENCKGLWTQLRWAAFNQELCARRNHGPGRTNRLRYEFGKPFPELTYQEMAVLVKRWPGDFVVNAATKEHVARPEIFQVGSRPNEAELMLIEEASQDELSLTEDEDKNQALMENMLRRRREINQLRAKPGWSTPKWISFDLNATNSELEERFLRFVAEQRAERGVVNPSRHGNLGEDQKTKHSGPTFKQIENLDIYANLSVPDRRKRSFSLSKESNARKKSAEALKVWSNVQRERVRVLLRQKQNRLETERITRDILDNIKDTKSP